MSSASFTLPAGYILYNDNVTSHLSRPDALSSVTKVAPQTRVEPFEGKFVFVFDPYTQSLFMVGRSGQLFKDWDEITLAEYRAYWAEVNFGN